MLSLIRMGWGENREITDGESTSSMGTTTSSVSQTNVIAEPSSSTCAVCFRLFVCFVVVFRPNSVRISCETHYNLQ